MSFVIYIFFQLVAYVVDFSIYAVLYAVAGFSPIISNFGAKAAAGCLAFFCHRTYTFKANAGPGIARQAMLYAALLILNIPLSSALLWSFMLLGIGPFMAKLAGDVCGVVINFVLLKFIAFTRPQHQA